MEHSGIYFFIVPKKRNSGEGCPERRGEYEQRGSQTPIAMTAVGNNREMRGQEEDTAKLRAE